MFNGVDFAMNARLRPDLFVTGGLRHRQHPFQQLRRFVDNPRTDFGMSVRRPARTAHARHRSVFNYCDFDTSWLTQVKADRLLHAAVAADPDRRRAAEPARPADSGAVEHHPGRRGGRNVSDAALSGGANTSRAVPLIKPGTMYTPRRTQLDLRVSKNFKLSRAREAAGDGGHLQRVQLERRGRARRRTPASRRRRSTRPIAATRRG